MLRGLIPARTHVPLVFTMVHFESKAAASCGNPARRFETTGSSTTGSSATGSSTTGSPTVTGRLTKKERALKARPVESLGAVHISHPVLGSAASRACRTLELAPSAPMSSRHVYVRSSAAPPVALSVRTAAVTRWPPSLPEAMWTSVARALNTTCSPSEDRAKTRTNCGITKLTRVSLWQVPAFAAFCLKAFWFERRLEKRSLLALMP